MQKKQDLLETMKIKHLITLELKCSAPSRWSATIGKMHPTLPSNLEWNQNSKFNPNFIHCVRAVRIQDFVHVQVRVRVQSRKIIVSESTSGFMSMSGHLWPKSPVPRCPDPNVFQGRKFNFDHLGAKKALVQHSLGLLLKF